MIRWGLRLLLFAVLLFVVGFAGAWSFWFEVARLAGTGCLALGLALLLVDHLLAPTEDSLTPDALPPSPGTKGTGSG
jgi:hypothetical protein